MRGYAAASTFPLAEIGGVRVPRLILGHLPFVGESYQGAAKNREYLLRFSRVENIVKILRKAVEGYGVTAIAAMPALPGSPSSRVLDAVKKTIRITDTEIAIVPCFRIRLTVDGKRVDDYRRWVTYYALEQRAAEGEVYRKYVKDPVLLCREGWGERFPEALSQLSPYNEREIRGLKVDYETLEEAVTCLDGFRVLLAEPGSESDFLAMVGRTDLLEEFANFLKDRLRCPIIVGTHHAGSTIPILEEGETRYAGYVTPVNRLGALMLPTTTLALEAIRRVRERVIAIKPLAGGRIPPGEAFEYVYGEVKVGACMVGVASEREVDEDFSSARRALSGSEPRQRSDLRGK